MSIDESADVYVSCRQCGQKHKKSVAWIRANRKIGCFCGAVIDYDAEGLIRAVAGKKPAPPSYRAKPPSFGRR